MSSHETSINISMRIDELILRIVNDNNPSLKIRSVKAYQLRRSLVSHLAAGHDYKVFAGGDSLRTPVYDLEFFRDSIPANPETLKLGEVKSLASAKATIASPTYFTNRNIIWIAIVIVIIVLGGMSVRMLKDKDLKG